MMVNYRPGADGHASEQTHFRKLKKLTSMRTFLWITFLVLLISGCGKPLNEKHIALDGRAVDWQQLSLPGKTLVLIHPTQVQVFPFRADSTVVATIGNDGTTGAVAGPILFWGTQGKFLIISRIPFSGSMEEHGDPSKPGSDAVEILGEPILDGDLLRATRMSGERVAYRLSKPEQP